MIPIFAFVQRRAARSPVADMTGAMRNVRPFEDITPDEYPDPIRRSEFVNEGRAWGKAQMPIAIPGYQPVQVRSVMQDEFGRIPVLEAEAPQAAVPHGSQLPFRERANIKRTPAIAYGSLLTLSPKTYDYSLINARTNAGLWPQDLGGVL